VFNTVFHGNTARDGAGIAASGSRVRNALFYLNRADNSGGGAHCGPGGAMDNCTLVFNEARRGGGAWCEDGALVRNSILYFNARGNLARRGADVRVTHSCVTPHVPGTGNITLPPRFDNPSADDFRLAPDSPCIDAAATLTWMARATDMDGTPRALGRAPDMGAFEFASAALLGAVTGSYDVCTLTNSAGGVPEPLCLPVTLLLAALQYKKRASAR